MSDYLNGFDFNSLLGTDEDTLDSGSQPPAGQFDFNFSWEQDHTGGELNGAPALGTDGNTFDASWMPAVDNFGWQNLTASVPDCPPALGTYVNPLDTSLFQWSPIGQETDYPTLQCDGGLGLGEPRTKRPSRSGDMNTTGNSPGSQLQSANTHIAASEDSSHDDLWHNSRLRWCGICLSQNCDIDLHRRRGLTCNISGCNVVFRFNDQRKYHNLDSHVPGHHPIKADNGTWTCIECSEIFKNEAQLHSHATSKQHSPFQCVCGTKCSRKDGLYRHIEQHAAEAPRFPCPNCKAHRGKQGFKRRDHLVQHLQGYHGFDSDKINKISPKVKAIKVRSLATCPHRGCEFYRDDSFQTLSWTEQVKLKPFDKHADFTKHLKEAHNETPFPCDVPGCDKTGAKGYAREKDLIKHRSAKHSEVDDYVISARPTAHKCQVSNCGKEYSTAQGLNDHRALTHMNLEERDVYFAHY